ncbi:protein of unknown function [Pseudomonas mediterranea]
MGLGDSRRTVCHNLLRIPPVPLRFRTILSLRPSKTGESRYTGARIIGSQLSGAFILEAFWGDKRQLDSQRLTSND